MKNFRLMSCAAVCGLLLASTQVFAADACAPGDEKCGPSGFILKCEKFGPSMDAKWMSTGRRCEGPAASSPGSSSYSSERKDSRQVCSEGDTKCGADGYVAECRNEKWKSTYKRCP